MSFVCTLLFTLTIVPYYVESINPPPSVVERNGKKYGLQFDGIVYPEGTYDIGYGGGFFIEEKRPYWAAPPAIIHPDDRLSRKGIRIARPMLGKFYEMNADGAIGLNSRGQATEVKPVNGDKLVRKTFYVAIYEGKAFRQYKYNCLQREQL